MRSFVIAAVLAVGLAPTSPARADGGPFGVGLVVGEPTGVTGAYHLSERLRIDAALGIDLFDDNVLYVHADLLFVLPDLLSSGTASLRPYLGPGAFVVEAGGDVGLGGRGPIGLSLELRRAPVEIFLELALSVLLVPDVHGDIGGALGFRYYF
jgi:hypothetical protein